MNPFKQKRESFYKSIPNFWADMYGEEYSLYDIRAISEKDTHRKRLFAYRCGKILFKTADLLARQEISDEDLLRLGFPKETLRLIRLQTMKNKTIIGRFDSVEVDGIEKLLEFNSDTPTFIKELFHINEAVCDEFRYSNPNLNEEKRLRAVLRDAIISEVRKMDTDEVNVVFTSHSDNIEDRNTVLYLQELAELPSRYTPLEKLRIRKGEGLYDDLDNKIDILYRQTFPIENLIEDEDPDSGEKIGILMLDLIEKNKLRIINPPSAFLLQNKAMMATVWALHEENNPFFTAVEHQWIESYFLPTYLDPAPFLKSGSSFVKKPAFGREGDTVEIYNSEGKKVKEDKQKSYTNHLSVYQQYVDLPKVKIQTVKGEQELHLMTGTFLLNGKPSAVGFRVGNQITDNLSYFLPCGYQQKG
ncbi:Glutathionylspermidine synthase [Terribacillus aidingensis]|uniref:Glutathionylspermidine synthase n=1 Tax=Terribacillus aidingensis TaxID=586416 RepID=A0A285P3E0_9BACI|nr:glutathionylspermidine synthase family protein [Terribacillus aidingensis]SNZ15958.1 Glutathionylspermidine synthase [Terribacillus aidingensis]